MAKNIFCWDAETGIASAIINSGEKSFSGYAICMEEDRDMMNEKTGCEIALMRAQLEYLIDIRDNQLKPAIKTLYELYNSIKNSKKFNNKSYEMKKIFHMINSKEKDLKEIKLLIKEQKARIKQYINSKEEFYIKVRKNRNKDKID